jgi:hypothetical protein
LIVELKLGIKGSISIGQSKFHASGCMQNVFNDYESFAFQVSRFFIPSYKGTEPYFNSQCILFCWVKGQRNTNLVIPSCKRSTPKSKGSKETRMKLFNIFY